MAVSVRSPEDIVNLAMVQLGKPRVENLYDGTQEARRALTIYAQTRDALMRDGQFPFARRTAPLVLQKTAPVGGYFPGQPWSNQFPLPPWKYQYAYLPDCIRILNLRAGPGLLPAMSPKPVTFTLANDNSFNPPQQVVLTDAFQAIANYTGYVTDMTTWEASFVEAFAAAIARRFVVTPENMPSAEQIRAAEEKNAAMVAGAVQG